MSYEYQLAAYSVISVLRFNIMMLTCLYYLNVASEQNFKESTLVCFKYSMFVIYLIFLGGSITMGYWVGRILSTRTLSISQLCICPQHMSLKWFEVIASSRSQVGSARARNTRQEVSAPMR